MEWKQKQKKKLHLNSMYKTSKQHTHPLLFKHNKIIPKHALFQISTFYAQYTLYTSWYIYKYLTQKQSFRIIFHVTFFSIMEKNFRIFFFCGKNNEIFFTFKMYLNNFAFNSFVVRRQCRHCWFFSLGDIYMTRHIQGAK